ncbi:MAG: siderophore ABC transporter substrate-binding protein [Rhizobiaceae bacterium]|nr:siderophore ABC transporter substrate-binding protein [Rhizobiaceae bacterium]
MNKYFLSFLLCVSLALCKPALTEEVSIDTYRGSATVEKGAKAIAVLDIAAVDTLDALGIDIAGMPTPHYVDYLATLAKETKSVGSLFEPDFEKLANMELDLIVAGGRSSRQYEQLSEVAPTIDMTIWGEDHLGQVLARLSAYGKILNKEDAAAALRGELLAKVELAKNTIAGKGNGLIVMANGPKVSAFGKGSRFGWLHAALDLPEAVEGVDEQTHGEVVSFEFIADANPDWLIVIDRAAAIGQSGDTASETLNNALVQTTNAWKNKNLVYLNSANIYIAGGGIQSMNQTLDEVIVAFGAKN